VNTAVGPEVPGLYPLLSLTFVLLIGSAGAVASNLLGKVLVDW